MLPSPSLNALVLCLVQGGCGLDALCCKLPEPAFQCLSLGIEFHGARSLRLSVPECSLCGAELMLEVRCFARALCTQSGELGRVSSRIGLELLARGRRVCQAALD